MLTHEKILNDINKNIGKIHKYGVKRIGIFGSFLTNEQNNKSDIDILIEFQKGEKTFDNYMDLKFFLENLFKTKVDLVIIEAIKPDLKENILGSVKYAA